MGDTSPSPCDPCLCGEPEGARAGCVPSLAQVFAIFTGASPWTHSLLVVRSSVTEGSPDLPGIFISIHGPAASLFSPYTLYPPLRSWKDSFDIHFCSAESWFSPAQKFKPFLETLEESDDRECWVLRGSQTVGALREQPWKPRGLHPGPHLNHLDRFHNFCFLSPQPSGSASVTLG